MKRRQRRKRRLTNRRRRIFFCNKKGFRFGEGLFAFSSQKFWIFFACLNTDNACILMSAEQSEVFKNQCWNVFWFFFLTACPVRIISVYRRAICSWFFVLPHAKSFLVLFFNRLPEADNIRISSSKLQLAFCFTPRKKFFGSFFQKRTSILIRVICIFCIFCYGGR